MDETGLYRCNPVIRREIPATCWLLMMCIQPRRFEGLSCISQYSFMQPADLAPTIYSPADLNYRNSSSLEPISCRSRFDLPIDRSNRARSTFCKVTGTNDRQARNGDFAADRKLTLASPRPDSASSHCSRQQAKGSSAKESDHNTSNSLHPSFR